MSLQTIYIADCEWNFMLWLLFNCLTRKKKVHIYLHCYHVNQSLYEGPELPKLTMMSRVQAKKRTPWFYLH